MTFPTTALMNQTPKIACLPNGPYYLLNDMTAAPVPNLRRANGEPCATVRGVALCRCGGSRNKPFCDGTPSPIGFRDQEREPAVTVTNAGPYAITGGIELMGVTFGDGASKEHYTLCRCGGSKNKPFCDGTHWQIGFRDPPEKSRIEKK